MKIDVEVADVFEDMLTIEHVFGEAALELPPGTTVMSAVARTGLPVDGQAYLLILNDKTVPASQHATHELKDGDSLAILMPLKGG